MGKVEKLIHMHRILVINCSYICRHESDSYFIIAICVIVLYVCMYVVTSIFGKFTINLSYIFIP